MSGCSIAGCSSEATFLPVVVFSNQYGKDVRAIARLPICDNCKKTIRYPSEVLADGGQAIADALEKVFSGVEVVRRSLAWTPIDGEEAKGFLEAGPKQ